MKKISIITICYNDRDGFAKTAESIANQELKEFEWIVIDGASTDGSVDIQKKYHQYMSFYLSEQDNGIYNAMNKGLQHVSGDYILFLNSGDCLFDASILLKVSEYLHDKDIYVGDIVRSNDIHQKPGFNLKQGINSAELLYQLCFFTLPHPASFFKSDYFKKYGMYDEQFRVISDWKAYLEGLLLGGATLEVLPFIITIFDVTGISSTTNKGVIEKDFVFNDRPMLKDLVSFYKNNYAIVTSMNRTAVGRFIGRLYYCFYRKIKKVAY